MFKTGVIGSIGTRLTLAVVITMLAVILVFTTQNLHNRFTERLAEARNELVSTGALVQSTLIHLFRAEQHTLIPQLFSELMVNPRHHYIAMVAEDCTIAFAYASKDQGLCVDQIRAGFSLDLLSQVISSGVSEYRYDADAELYRSYIPIQVISEDQRGGERYVIILLSSVASSEIDLQQILFDQWLGAIGWLLILALIVRYYLRRKIERPLVQLVGIVDRIKSGELVESIKIYSRDEIGRLARALEQMSIERNIADARLRDAAEVFRSTVEGVVLTDARGVVRDVNDAFVHITGYSRNEVIGQNPRFLQSGRHPDSFYQAMWTSIQETGSWRGEIWNRRKNGDLYPELLTLSSIIGNDGQLTGYVGVFTDISTLKESEQRIEHLAQHDPLTDLPNKALFDTLLMHGIEAAKRNATKLAVVYIDLDRFKYLNDTQGHAFGDQLLRQVANRLRIILPADATLARVSGDEFVLLLESIDATEEVLKETDTIMNAIRSPFEIAGQQIHLTVSIGVSIYPDDTQLASELISFADAAMHGAKESGRNSCRFYTTDLSSLAQEHFALHNALVGAIELNQFFLVYQPQINLQTRDYIGMEVLLRWNHPDLGLVSPARFIPVAESTGLIRDIGHWVLLKACQQANLWDQQGFSFGRISVNVAGAQFIQPEFVDQLAEVLADTGMRTELLELEVTESFIMRDPEAAVDKLNQVRQMGIRIALDDFGTGYSSLSYLKLLPIDKLKIDQSFVRDLLTNKDDRAIAAAVVALGRALNMEVIAEGVETEAQVSELIRLGCDQGQGYLISKPVRPDQLWFTKQNETGQC